MDLRRVASTAAIVLGAIMILAGIATAAMVTSELDDQNIVTPDDACLSNRQVRDPFTAWCQAEIIDKHALESTGGLTYAQLERDDPRRDLAMNASFLRASLYTSIVAYGVAAMAAAIGLLFILIGLGMRDVRRQVEEVVHEVEREPVVVGAAPPSAASTEPGPGFDPGPGTDPVPGPDMPPEREV